MTRQTFHIGTLLIIATAAAIATVPNRDARTQPRDEGRRHPATYCRTCERTPAGRIKRNTAARNQFRLEEPSPATGSTSGPCPGYVVDHIRALKRGGEDTPANMQWQTTAQARAKDRAE